MTRSESDKFCLRWNDFCSNLGAALEEVREEKELYDVTVACEGGGEFPAHRLVLSACSLVMRQILCRKSQLGGRHHQEVVYLRGVASQDLQHILTFMYCGEVSIAQEQINSFLAVAEDLQVKGLTQNKSRTESSKQSSLSQRHTTVSEGSQQETTPAPTTTNVKRESNTWKLTSPSKISSLHDEREIVHYDNGGVDGDNIYDDEYTSQFDDQNLAYGSGGVHKNMRNTVWNISGSREGDSLFERSPSGDFACVQCGYTTRLKQHMQKHVQTHMDGPGHQCQYCFKIYKTENSLQSHTSTKHGVKKQNYS